VLHGVFPSVGERTRVSVSPPKRNPSRQPAAGFVGVAEQRSPRRGQPGHHPEGPRQPASRPPAGPGRSVLQEFFSNSSARRTGRRIGFRRPGLGSGVIFDKRGLVLQTFT